MSFPMYPEYKYSDAEWLGKVPNNWTVAAIKWLSPVLRGASPRPIDDPIYFDDDGEYGWVRISDVTASKDGYLKGTTQKLSAIGSSLSVKLEPGKLFLSIAGSVGKPCITKIQACIHDGFVYFPLLNIDQRFLYRIFELGSCFGGLGKMGTQLNLNTDTVGGILIAIPPMTDLTNILRFLDYETAKIDTLIHEQKRLIELLKEKRQAVISHAVTKGLDPDVPMKDSGVEWLGEVPAHWSVEPLKYLCSFSGGGTPAKENLEYWNGDIPWVSPKDMKSFRISGSKDKITGLALNESSTSLVKAGALLMVVRSGILQRTIPIGINSVDVTLNQDMKALRFKNPDFAEYFAYFIKGYEPSLLIEWRKQGATVESIEQEYLGESLTLVPPLNEVAKIIEHLSHVDQRYGSLQAEAKKSSAMLLERRSALISAAVTGKIDVRNWQPPADGSAFNEEMRQAEMKVTA
jgi:type I restriction enzyme S subunit